MKKLVLCMLGILCLLPISQLNAQFFGDITSVTLSSNGESQTATYTITALAADDNNTGASAVTAGQLGAVVFPTGTQVANVTTGRITVGNTTTAITGITVNATNNIFFPMPVSVPAGTGFTMEIDDVINPPINPACGTSANDYASAAPCDQFVQVYMVNTLNDTNQPNVYHHNGIMRYSIVPSTYFVSDIEVDKPNSADVVEGAPDQEMIRVRVTVGGSSGTLPQVSSFAFNSGTSLTADIDQAHVWSTGTDQSFHGSNDVILGSVNTVNNSTLNFPVNFTLTEGLNTFWLVYDVGCYPGIIGNSLDAVFDGIVIDNTNFTEPTPAGTRTVAQNLYASSSNLVPNPGFENFSACPSVISQISLADDWGLIPITGNTFIPSSPDYFHACAPSSSEASVPHNNFGTQAPRSGSGYAGIYTSGFFDWKEYLQVKLSSPLQAGETYAVTYFVTGANYDSTSTTPLSRRHNGMGFYLSPTQVTTPFSIYGVPPTVSPQYVNNDVITDHVDWVPISGTFTAQGGEEWLVIGCFIENANITTNGGGGFGYYYIDDVTVTAVDDLYLSPCTQMELLVETTPESCVDADDGTASIQVFGGVPPYSIAWSDNGSGSNRGNLAPGIYNITVTDNGNNTYQDVVFIDEADPIDISFNVQIATNSTSQDGSIQSIVSGGASPYAYAWSNGATTPNINNLAAGQYSLTLTDANGCTATLGAFVSESLACNSSFSNFPYSYDLEKGLGLFKQNKDDDLNWKRRTTPTPTANTGPSTPNSGSYFRYLESSGNGSPGKVGVLTTKRCLNITALNNPVFEFYYNLNGAQMGELYVQVSTDGGQTWTGAIWSTAGDQGDVWQKASIDLSPYSSTQTRLRIVGVTGTGGQSDMAIDNYYIGENNGSSNFSLPPVEWNAIAAEQVDEPAPFRVYPNPSRGTLNLSWEQQSEEATQLRIYNRLGQQVYQELLYPSLGQQYKSLNLELPQGMYFVRLETADSFQLQPLVIIP